MLCVSLLEATVGLEWVVDGSRTAPTGVSLVAVCWHRQRVWCWALVRRKARMARLMCMGAALGHHA